MKKLLIISTLMFCSFFIIDKVGATSLTAYYDSDYVQEELLPSTDTDYLNNQLIPFIESNFQNYFVSIILSKSPNNSYSVGYIYVMPRNTANDGAVFMYLNNGYTSKLDFFPYTTIDSDFVVSGRVRGYARFDYRTDNNNLTNNTINVITALQNWLNSPSYGYPNDFLTMLNPPACNSSTCNVNFLNGSYSQITPYISLPYYINYPSILATTLAYQDYQGNYIVHYGDTDYTFELGDPFPTYYYFVNNMLTPPNKIVTFDVNTFGFYNNIISLQNLSADDDLFTIICEKDKPFENDYCSMNYLDLLSNNSDINYYNDSLFNFHMFFTNENSGILRDNTYYVYSFRLQQPFHPEVSGIVLNTTKGDFYYGNAIDNVYLVDGGSYTDYIIVFHTESDGFVSNDKINYLSIYFREPLNYYYKTIPSSFNFSVFRSSKLKLYTSLPSANDINDFISTNDLSSINSNVSQNSFFTDTQFKTYGFGGIITAPFRLLYAILDFESCSTITLPFPHSSNTLNLTCVRSSIPSGLSPLISLLQLFLSGIICYRIAVGTLSTIKQMFDPAVNSIEVMDL